MEPYPLIVVRPSGAAIYGIAQRAIHSSDFQFGYELVEEDWELKYPAADPQLALVEQRAIEQARIRQYALAAAAPRAYRHPAMAAAGRFDEFGDGADGFGGWEDGDSPEAGSGGLPGTGGGSGGSTEQDGSGGAGANGNGGGGGGSQYGTSAENSGQGSPGVNNEGVPNALANNPGDSSGASTGGDPAAGSTGGTSAQSCRGRQHLAAADARSCRRRYRIPCEFRRSSQRYAKCCADELARPTSRDGSVRRARQ